MPRNKRLIGLSNVYHIITRGIDKQDIFYDDKDRSFFLKQLLEVKKKFNLEIYAYCLMYNHVHLVIRSQNNLVSKSIQSLGIRYSQYFNRKYNRSGPLFEERFKSKCVENKKYFLDVCRYVHRNPETAGFCSIENYLWSSYNEYLNKEKIIDKKILLHYFDNDLNKFINFTVNQKRDLYEETKESLEYEFISKLTDEDLSKIIIKRLKLKSIMDLTHFNKKERIYALRDLKNIPGTNKTQLARVTRISRFIIERIWSNLL